LYILGITTKTKIREVQLPIMWWGNTLKHYGNTRIYRDTCLCLHINYGMFVALVIPNGCLLIQTWQW